MIDRAKVVHLAEEEPYRLYQLNVSIYDVTSYVTTRARLVYEPPYAYEVFAPEDQAAFQSLDALRSVAKQVPADVWYACDIVIKYQGLVAGYLYRNCWYGALVAHARCPHCTLAYMIHGPGGKCLYDSTYWVIDKKGRRSRLNLATEDWEDATW